jgi:hypothetical protein
MAGSVSGMGMKVSLPERIFGLVCETREFRGERSHVVRARLQIAGSKLGEVLGRLSATRLRNALRIFSGKL